ncbi:MAG TPA: histidine phosphatase family protein [Solirubrobacterales bacterium]|jgi:broad specificity phosphatase PhoE
MSRVLLLRHGESAGNAHTGSETLNDEESDRLTETGRAQAHAAGPGLVSHGPTRLLTSPMRRAVETAEILGAAIGLEPSVLPHVHELERAESFEDALGRVRRLKVELEAAGPDERTLVVSHGIFIRFFLFDSLLGEEFVAPMAAGTWSIGSRNCGLSLFSHGEAYDPWGNAVQGWACHFWMERPWDREG